MSWKTHAALAFAGFVLGAPAALTLQSARPRPPEIWLRSATPVSLGKHGIQGVLPANVRFTKSHRSDLATLGPDCRLAVHGALGTWGRLGPFVQVNGVTPTGDSLALGLQTSLARQGVVERWERLVGLRRTHATYIFEGAEVVTDDGTWYRLILPDGGR